MSNLMTTDEMLALLGFSYSTLRTVRASGEFIEPVRLSKRRIAWRATDVEAWIASR